MELQNLDTLSVILSQEVEGPPENVVNNLYNVIWLERNETGGYMGCVRKGISFGKHQTGRLVRVYSEATRVILCKTIDKSSLE